MEKETVMITRKYTLLPVMSDNPQYLKKLMEYTKKSYEEKIDYFENKLKKAKGKEEKEKVKNKLLSLQENKKEFEASGTLTQTNVTDYTYDFVRNAMQSEARRKNAIISYVFSELLNQNARDMEFKERNRLIQDLVNYGYRVKGSSRSSLFDDKFDIENLLGAYGIAFSQTLTAKIKNMVNKDGVLEGRSSLISYKDNSPFSITKNHMSFSHNYDSYEELCEHIYEKDCPVYFHFGSHGKPTILNFQINFGAGRHKKNKNELISTITKIISGEYTYAGSSIGIEKNKIILNLSIAVPKKEKKLDENTVVGVNLGVIVPAMCALNNDMYERLAIGSADEFLRQRTKIQAQRKRLQKALKDTSGGHGRKKKLQALDRLSKAEKHFTETYCHMVSKRIVDFALQHNAKYINIENLKGFDTNDFVLRNWSYYKLQEYITYKAAKYDIIVRKVNPCYNSQVCNVCGAWIKPKEKPQRIFICANDKCESHKKYKKGYSTDFNTARNVAKSTLFVENGEITNKKFEEARQYYGIPEEEENTEE